jgi:hypothetical protein
MKGPVFQRQLRFCLTDRLAQEAAEAAAAEGETMSSVMRLALREWLANRGQRHDGAPHNLSRGARWQ